MIPRGGWLIVLLCLFPVTHVWGMIGEEPIDISPSDHFTIVWYFEYATGGHLDMDITLLDTPSSRNDNVSLQFLLCSDAQIDPLRTVKFTEVCAGNEFKNHPCEYQVSMGAAQKAGTSVHFNLTTPTTDWYRLLQLNCKQQAWSAMLSYVAVNPGGEYLSLSQVPYKTLYVVVSCLWIGLGAAWVYNWWRYRFFNVKLQRLLSLVPLTKLLLSFIELYYWREASITGHFPTNIYWLWLVMVSVDWVTFHIALLICAKGWSITRKQLSRIERNRMITLVGVLLVAYAIYKYFAGFLLFFLVVMYVLLLRYIFIAVVENTSSLLEQFDYVRRMEVDPQVTPVWIKLQMFRRFQVAMVIYISVDIIFHLWTTIFARSMPWIEDMMENVICALLSIAIGYIFAMRPFNPYFYRIVNHYTDSQGNQRNEQPQHEQHQENSLEQSLIGHQHPPAGRHGSQADQAQYACEWRPGMPIPPIPHDTEAWLKETTEEEAPIILVENPFNADYHSNAQETVVVAAPAYEGRGIIIATSRSRRTGSVASRSSGADLSGAPDLNEPLVSADGGPPYPGETMLVRMQRSLSGALQVIRHRSSSASSSSGMPPSSSAAYRQLEEGTSSQELVTRHTPATQASTLTATDNATSTSTSTSTRQVATSSSSQSTSRSSSSHLVDPVEEKSHAW